MPPQTQSLEGKVALVTGAGKGIGAGIAHELGVRGAKVAINYNSSAGPAETLAQEIKAAGGDALALQADISVPDEIERLFQAVLQHYGHLDIVVSNSGIEHFAALETVQPADFDRVFNLNTQGQFFVGQAAYKHLSDNGRLILMSSISARNAIKEHAVYAGSKCAVEAFARCFAPDFGARGITVNSISPGGVKTDMAADVGYKYIPGADASWTMGDIEEFVTRRTPMRRMAMPVDVARVVAFLVSEDGAWMSGKLLVRASDSLQILADDCRTKFDNLGWSRRVSTSSSTMYLPTSTGLGDLTRISGMPGLKYNELCRRLNVLRRSILGISLVLGGASEVSANVTGVCKEWIGFRTGLACLHF